MRDFKSLKVVDGWKWTLNIEKSFQWLVEVLTQLPVLAKVCLGYTLYLYYAVSEYAVSSNLLKKDKDGVQCLIFCISRVLRGAESKYPEVKKKAFVVVYVAQRLHPYFQAHHMVVVKSDPLRKMPHGPIVMGRLIP